MVTIALGSQSSLKKEAIEHALKQFGIDAQVTVVQSRFTGDIEQPFGLETLREAKKRADYTASIVHDADVVIAIESGIFVRQAHPRAPKRYFDVAIVLTRLPHGEYLSVESESIEYQAAAVEETPRRDNVTIGHVVVEMGLVQQHDDPHKALTIHPRFKKTGLSGPHSVSNCAFEKSRRI